MTSTRHSNNIVDLNILAGADTKITMDTGIKVDTHCNMAAVNQRNMGWFYRRKSAPNNTRLFDHFPKM
jgi:hypothetical protein